jgi:hypothetical protein
LKPKRNFNQYSKTDESAKQCYERLLPEFGIPYEVIDQWIYLHYYNGNTVNNYGWIDYWNIKYEKVSLEKKSILSLNVVKKYQRFVRERSLLDPYRNIACREIDLDHWKRKNTWRVPPVVIDVASFETPPVYSDFCGSIQLVEGHSRLGFFRAMERENMMDRNMHEVYLIRKSDNKTA